jgi:hypothetical protein
MKITFGIKYQELQNKTLNTMKPSDYENMKLGFDRTQLFKEHEGPMIRRAAAMNMAQKFFDTNEIKYSPLELKSLYLGFYKLIEEGDDSIFQKLDSYLTKNLSSSSASK